MNKSYFEKYIMDDIGSGIRKHRYYILPSVKWQIKDRVHQYVMSLNDKDFESPSYVSEMIKRKNEFVAKLMHNAENSFITTRSFNVTEASYCKTYPCKNDWWENCFCKGCRFGYWYHQADNNIIDNDYYVECNSS